MLSTSFRARTLKLYSGQNFSPVGARSIMEQILIDFFFFPSKGFFHLFLGPLNMLSTSFHSKNLKLNFSQNSWSVGSRGIVEQI